MSDGIMLIIVGSPERESVVWRGVRETHAPLYAPELRRTCSGRLIRLWNPFAEKVAVTLSADGDRAYPPALDLVQPGRQVILHSSIWRTASRYGDLRWPVATREDGTPYRFDDVDVRGEPIVRYRPQITCRVTGWDTSGSATDRQAGWTMRMEEA